MTRDNPVNRRFACGFLVLILLALIEFSPSRCLASIWIDTTSGGLWSKPGNWTGGNIADGTGATADFSTLNITANNTVHLDSARAVGFLNFGDTTPSNNWTLDNNGNSLNTLTLAASSGSPVIQVKNQTATINAVLAGSQGFFTASGTGTLALAAANTLSGATFVEGGFLQLSSGLALQNSTLAQVNSNSLIFGESIGTFTLGGLSGAYPLSLSDKLGAAISLSIGNNNASTSYTGTLSGAGSLNKIGSGTLSLGASNPYTGQTTILGGVLLLTTSAVPLPNSTVVCNSAGGLAFSQIPSTDVTIGGLAGTGGISLTTDDGFAITLDTGGNGASTSYSGILSGPGGLKKLGAGTLTLSGANSYSGWTNINGGAIKLDGVGTVGSPTGRLYINSGFLDLNGVSSGVGPIISGLNSTKIVNNKSGTLATLTIDTEEHLDAAFAGMIADNSAGTGTIALLKTGPASEFIGVGAYSGTTTVQQGTIRFGFLAKNGSATTFISAGPDFSTAALIRSVQPRGSYAGFGSTAIGIAMGTSADLRAGTTFSGQNIEMQWRVRGAGDRPGLGSDILNLTGMSPIAGTHIQTDPFALQMTYSPGALGGDESTLASEGLLALGWLDTSQNQPSGLWRNAIAGNFGTGRSGDVFPNVQSSWDAFSAAHSNTDANVGNFLGSYGVDVGHHVVWAVLNHNSQFAVVPEPSSVVLLLFGALLSFFYRRVPRIRPFSSSASGCT